MLKINSEFSVNSPLSVKIAVSSIVFIDDAIEISKQSNNYDVANLLNKIFVLHDFDMQLCYEVLSKTHSINLKSIIQNTLETTRKNLIEKNKLLQEVLKEI